MPNKFRWIHCAECSQNRLHKAGGLCNSCYDRQRREDNPEGRRRNHRRYRESSRMEQEHIYLVYAPDLGRYKIGRSHNPVQRVRSLGGSPCAVELVWSGPCGHASLVERALHARFRDQRAHGEWFKGLTPEQIEFIKQQAC